MIASPLPMVSAATPAANTSGSTRVGPDVEGGAFAGTFPGAFAGTFSDALGAASASADARAAATVDRPREWASQQEPDPASATGRRTSPGAPGGTPPRAKVMPGRPLGDAPSANVVDVVPVGEGVRSGERPAPSVPDAKTRDGTERLAPAAEDTALLLAELQALHAPSTAVAAASGTVAGEPKAAALRGAASGDGALVMASQSPDGPHKVLLARGRQEPPASAPTNPEPQTQDRVHREPPTPLDPSAAEALAGQQGMAESDTGPIGAESPVRSQTDELAVTPGQSKFSSASAAPTATATPAPNQTHLDMPGSAPSKDKAAPAPDLTKSAAPAGSDPDMRLPVPSGGSTSNASTPAAVAIAADAQATAAALAPAGSGDPAAATQRDNGLAVATLPPQVQMPALPPFAAALGTAAAVHEGRLTAAPGSADFAGQLGTQITTFVREGVQHARLQLHPAELGPVTVRIQLDGQAAQVHLTAEHALTRQALEQSMPTLAGSLREAGLTLSGGGVFDQPRQRGDNPADPTASGPRQPRGNDRDAETPSRPLAAARSRRGVVDLVA